MSLWVAKCRLLGINGDYYWIAAARLGHRQYRWSFCALQDFVFLVCCIFGATSGLLIAATLLLIAMNKIDGQVWYIPSICNPDRSTIQSSGLIAR